MKEFVINENDAFQRLDKFVQKACVNMPKSLMFRFIRQKKIKVNRKRSKPAYILMPQDHVQLFISDEFFEAKKMDIDKTEDLYDIFYEDSHILVVDKPVGVIAHSNEKKQANTLIQQVIKYLVNTHQYDPAQENSFVPAFVNRLDQNTGGLMIACKDAKSLRYINELIRQHQVEKHYLCIIEGKLDDGEYEHYYVKDHENNKAFIYDEPKAKSVQVALKVKTLHQGKTYSLLDIHLITGKSHQIRAQLSHLHHPLIGDVKYGGKKIMKHQALYAYKLCFHSNHEDFNYLNKIKLLQKDNFVIKKYKQIENVEVEIE